MSSTSPRRPDTAPVAPARPDGSPASTRDARTHPELPRPKTSAAAVFALVFGLSALFCILTVFLAPLGIALGLIAVILGIAGIGKSRRPEITGKGVAISGLVLGLLGLLVGAAILAGVAVYFNDPDNMERVEQELRQLREALPTEIPNPG